MLNLETVFSIPSVCSARVLFLFTVFFFNVFCWCSLCSICSLSVLYSLCVLLVFSVFYVFCKCSLFFMCFAGVLCFLCVLLVFSILYVFCWCCLFTICSVNVLYFLCVLFVLSVCSIWHSFLSICPVIFYYLLIKLVFLFSHVCVFSVLYVSSMFSSCVMLFFPCSLCFPFVFSAF